MKNLLNPKWIFIINSLPLAILIFIFYGEFQVINSLLEDEIVILWKSFGWSLVALAIINFGYGVYLTITKRNVSFIYGLVALFCYIPFIYLYGHHINEIIPRNIPRWMIPENLFVYVGTFLMPTLAYSLLILVFYFTPKAREKNALKSFFVALMIPFFGFIFTQIILPLWQPVGNNFERHTLLILGIIVTLMFLFFLVRGILIFVSKKATLWNKYQLVWKIPISIILPLVGLSVNNGHLFNDFVMNNSGVFGNFNNYWFYSLAIINGLFICLPNLDNKTYRLLLFIGRCVTFAYTLYFFIVFLPFLPLSVAAIIAVGTGFLMLTPLLLFSLHVNEISKDFSYLKTRFKLSLVRLFSIVGFLIIPISLTLSYLKDKSILNQTLDYIYSPDYSKTYEIDKTSLDKILSIIKKNKSTSRGGIFGSQQPYLSSYFNWIVMDNLTLSDTKISTIERIFFGEKSYQGGGKRGGTKNVDITDISSSSTFDKSQNTWKSWIDIEITNNSGNAWFSEYVTSIELPVGTWISDYYLFVGDKKEMGILAEKRTAMWVYSSIRNENKDPGILFYKTGKKVAFRVFPFTENEVRKTGIELIHKEPIQITIDGNTIDLGDTKIKQESSFENENVIYLSSVDKQKLSKVTRTPYFHFLVDASNEETISIYSERIDEITRKHSELSKDARISFVNSYVSTTVLVENWKQEIENQSYDGGFYVDRGIKTVLYNSYNEQKNSYPVMVVVTDNLNNAIFEKDFSDWEFSFPETNIFYNLTKNGDLESHSLTSNPSRPNEDSIGLNVNYSVLSYPLKNNKIRYIADNNKPSIILKNDQFEIEIEEINEKNWNSALTMNAQWTSQLLHPDATDREWLKLVKSSFISKVMTPVTSYLVVENEAQKAILKKKQKQVLSSKKSLDLDEDSRKMSEPGLILISLLLGIILWLKRKRMLNKQI